MDQPKIERMLRLMKMMPQIAPDFDSLMYFSEEESYLINSLLDALVPTNALKRGIKDKLAVVVDSTASANYVDRRSNAASVQNLAREIRIQDSPAFEEYVREYIRTCLSIDI